MEILTIKTRKFLPPKDNLWMLLTSSLPRIKEKTIVCIASKIVSIGEGRCVLTSSVKNKDRLIKREAEKYLPREATPGGWVMHTLKKGLLIPTAGIDESNGRGYYVLWPKNPERSAKKIWSFLRKKYNLKNLGVIICDSHSVPMRRGTVGVSIAFWGFKPLKDYRGKKDIFGKTLQVSMVNIPDSLATAAVFVMGEGAEQTPVALITSVQGLTFTSRAKRVKKPYTNFIVPLREDLYRPFLTSVPWRRGKGGSVFPRCRI